MFNHKKPQVVSKKNRLPQQDGLILLQELPICKAGTAVTCDNEGGIYRKFAGTLQLVARVDDLSSYVGAKPRPKPTPELSGDAYVQQFKERMGWAKPEVTDAPTNV